MWTCRNSDELCEVANLEEGETVVFLDVGQLQVLQDNRTIGEHPHHGVIMIFRVSQQVQLISRALTH